MKKHFGFLVVVVVLLMLVFGMASGAVAGSSDDMEFAGRTLSFDGFCDGVSLDFPGGEYANGSQCGCVTSAVWGNKRGGAHLTNDPAGAYADIHTVLRGDGTWALYSPTGLLNSGTWSNNCPLNPESLPSAYEAAKPVALEMVPMKNITFDGFCDGMTLTRDGEFVNGSYCGCTSDPVFGSTRVGRISVSPEAATGIGWAHYDIRVDGTFSIYDQTGSFLEGTWSPGCPVLDDVEGLPSTVSR